MGFDFIESAFSESAFNASCSMESAAASDSSESAFALLLLFVLQAEKVNPAKATRIKIYCLIM